MTLTKTDRARVTLSVGRHPCRSARPGPLRGATAETEPTAPMASRNTAPNRGARTARLAGVGRPSRRYVTRPTRLSATDISALASMKNVAKCDTWCELQNPANHRVFERKLRPRPSGRGHACLGVTPKDAPKPPPGDGGRGVWLPVPQGAVGRRSGCRRTARRARHEVGDLSRSRSAASPRAAVRTAGPRTPRPKRTTLGPRPQVRREHPLSLSI